MCHFWDMKTGFLSFFSPFVFWASFYWRLAMMQLGKFFLSNPFFNSSNRTKKKSWKSFTKLCTDFSVDQMVDQGPRLVDLEMTKLAWFCKQVPKWFSTTFWWLVLLLFGKIKQFPVLFFKLFFYSFSKRGRGPAGLLADETGSWRRPQEWRPRHLRVRAVFNPALRLLRHSARRFLLRQFSGKN